ncbi:uncharacterized protein LOC141617736 [Silene latifolia]|uniref:uncharacterized protein LOC141617736 n=1 Tax=Silene latifolia TaxID=37657 RepID=UPI003D772C6E
MPNELRMLFMSNDAASQNFRKYVLLYNRSFAFTSFGVKKDRKLAQRNRGIYTFRVQGQVYHYINDILPTEERSRYIQLYFFDTDRELWHRLHIAEEIDRTVLRILMRIMEMNPYTQFFKSLRDVGWHRRIYRVSSHPRRRPDPQTFPINEVLIQTTDDLLESEEQGRIFILPASFIGCDPDFRRRYLSSMTLVQRYGKPDIFLTITCNPRWAEIERELLPFEEAKIRPPDQYDEYIYAELPDSAENPHLFSVVVRHMMDGPCGRDNPTNPCMRDGWCKNHYPREFTDTTTNGRDSYPIYRRRHRGLEVTVRGSQLNNRWVIPYNPFLLGKYECHLNVEICSTIKAIKYMYKYVYKGHDRISFAVTDPSGSGQESFDEITAYQSTRWISPPEAAWRIFGFHLNEIHPNIVPLQVHLPNMQTVSFQPWENLENVLDDEAYNRTMLTTFFQQNETDTFSQTLLYSQLPAYYVWHNRRRDKFWTPREKGFVLGRLVYANPSEGERYYLRLLLSNIRGPKSFEDLKSINGITCSSFRESDYMHGLLEADDSIEQCLAEAVQYQMPAELRRLFATLLIYCQPMNPRLL